MNLKNIEKRLQNIENRSIQFEMINFMNTKLVNNSFLEFEIIRKCFYEKKDFYENSKKLSQKLFATMEQLNQLIQEKDVELITLKQQIKRYGRLTEKCLKTSDIDISKKDREIAYKRQLTLFLTKLCTGGSLIEDAIELNPDANESENADLLWKESCEINCHQDKWRSIFFHDDNDDTIATIS